jgi:hypothetical protein
MFDKQTEHLEKKKDDESKKMKIDSKQKIIEDMQMRIASYKTELIKSRKNKNF